MNADRPPFPFLMSAEQHRARADQVEARNPELAKNHRIVANLIEARQRKVSGSEPENGGPTR